MENVIGVRFKKTGKLYYFDPLHYGFRIGDNVIANTERGEEMGRVVKILKFEELATNIQIHEIIKPATKNDLEIFKDNETKALEALIFCKAEVKKLKLNMKLLCAEYTFDASKLIIYFVSEDRVDFRELVRNIASKYKARIELRQIGPRDEIKTYPNLGLCGKEVCCRTFLQDFEPVTIKMAKEQGLQINMSKLSGACGKLMCCLKYEEESYRQNLKMLPKIGELVKVDGEKDLARVTNIDILGLKVKVRFGTNRDDERFEVFPVEKVKYNIKDISE
ncbi:MAG: regulatory iron-sulfur-containing complex subunit RicT [Bacilli bacterium]